ncbi:MAG: phycobilisome protein [Pseudanabaena sp. ELA607]|jgi:hypothetical protein
MLSHLQEINLEIDKRYASDDELLHISQYVSSFSQRCIAYQELQKVEDALLQKVAQKLNLIDGGKLFQFGAKDVTDKWYQDTRRVLRHSALAMLLNDPKLLQNRFLYWFQTIMQAFGTQRACTLTYTVMEETIDTFVSEPTANLVKPILVLNRETLGEKQHKA